MPFQACAHINAFRGGGHIFLPLRPGQGIHVTASSCAAHPSCMNLPASIFCTLKFTENRASTLTKTAVEAIFLIAISLCSRNCRFTLHFKC